MLLTCRPGGSQGTARFISTVREMDQKIDIKFDDVLHEKGLLTDSFYLAGSMNFTHFGLNIKRESVRLETSAEKVAEQHCLFSEYWNSISGGTQID